ncbi:MAG: hypothetical protein PVH68_08815 [Armatimonadota bacterium]|jgi:hypothetical protein
MANRRRQVSVLVCGVLCVLWAWTGPKADVGRRIGRARIILTTSVDEAVANGRSDVLVRAECLDTGTSRPVTDGTLVLFSTDAGDLSADRIHGQKQVTVETQNGFAEAFISSSEPHTVTITATALGDSRDSISIEFVPEGTLSRGRRGVFRVKAVKIPPEAAADGEKGRRKKPQYGSVNYSMDHNVIEAWHAAVTHRKLEIEAPHIVVSIEGEYVRAWDATLRLKRARLQGDDVYYSLRRRKGVLWHVTEDGAVERVEFSGATLKAIDDGSFDAPDLVDSQDWLAETRVWFVCRSAMVAPRRKIVLRQPTLWVEDKQLARLPRYHVIQLDGQQSGVVQFNSTGGLSIDYPYYLHASSGEVRAVHVQKGSQLDSLIPREGWSLCLSDEYDTSGASGKVWLEGLPASDWSLQWRHHEQRDAGSLRTYYFGSRSLDTFQADATFSAMSRRLHRSTRLNVSAFPHAPMHLSASTDFMLMDRPVGNTDLYHRIGTRVSFTSRDYWADGAVFQHQISNGLSIRPWQPDRKTRVRPSIDSIFTWNTRPSIGNYLRFQVSADRRIDSTQHLGLRYSIGQHLTGATHYGGLRQQVDLNYSLARGGKWSLGLNGTYDIGQKALYGYGSASYQVSRKYRLSAMASLYRWRQPIPSVDLEEPEFTEVGFNEVDCTLWRSIGQREVGLRYSTYDNRISFEIGGF